MSEKRKIQRFNLDEGRIWEAIEGLSPFKTTYTLEEVCEKLNEQQATITELEKEVNLLKPTNIEQYEQIQKLQKENEKLKQKVDFYKYFQKDARELEKENEQLRENLHNCRLNKNIISEKLKLWQDVHKEYDIYNINDFEELMKENE